MSLRIDGGADADADNDIIETDILIYVMKWKISLLHVANHFLVVQTLHP